MKPRSAYIRAMDIRRQRKRRDWNQHTGVQGEHPALDTPDLEESVRERSAEGMHDQGRPCACHTSAPWTRTAPEHRAGKDSETRRTWGSHGSRA